MMNCGANLLSLPFEVLECILCSSSLNADDILRVCTVSASFRDVARSNRVWKNKFTLRYMSLADKYLHCSHRVLKVNHLQHSPLFQIPSRWPGVSLSDGDQNSLDWFTEYRKWLDCGRRVRSIISGMSIACYKWEVIPDSAHNEISSIVKDDANMATVVCHTLHDILNNEKHKRLTEKYYAGATLAYVERRRLQETLSAYFQKPSHEQPLEQGAVIIAQWFQPLNNITYKTIARHIDSIAAAVKTELIMMHPQLPVCSYQAEHHTVLDESLWSPEQCKIILETINNVLFYKMGFHGSSDNYYNIDNSFINKVLEKKAGIPITLCVLYISISQRLGVLCQPVNFPSHFLIRWRHHPLASGSDNYTFIDVFNKGRFLSRSDCASILGGIHSPLAEDSMPLASSEQVLQRMGRNLMNIARQPGALNSSTLEGLLHTARLCILLDKTNEDVRIMAARLNHHMNINHDQSLAWLAECSGRPGLVSPIIEHLSAAIRRSRDKDKADDQETIKLRSENPDVKYSIGIIMKHRRYDYSAVILGWDKQCQASDEWIDQMGVPGLPRGRHQPFYNVLVEDGSSRYAAEDNIDFAPNPVPITHSAVNKYFDEFCGTYYKANAEKAAFYPDDIEATIKICTEHYGQIN